MFVSLLILQHRNQFNSDSDTTSLKVSKVLTLTGAVLSLLCCFVLTVRKLQFVLVVQYLQQTAATYREKTPKRHGAQGGAAD